MAEMVLVPGAAKSLVALADKVADRILGIRARQTRDPLPAICSAGNGGATGAPAEPVFSRDPLTDPRAGDIVTAYDGSVLEVTGAVLGYGACVWIREDSTRYTLDHDRYREIVRGGSVIRRAEEVGA